MFSVVLFCCVCCLLCYAPAFLFCFLFIACFSDSLFCLSLLQLALVSCSLPPKVCCVCIMYCLLFLFVVSCLFPVFVLCCVLVVVMCCCCCRFLVFVDVVSPCLSFVCYLLLALLFSGYSVLLLLSFFA